MATWIYKNKITQAQHVAHYTSESVELQRNPDLELVVIMNWPWRYQPEWDEWRDVWY